MDELRRFHQRDLIGVVAFLVLWGGSTAYLGLTGADWVFPFVALGIFGIGLSAIAWATTRGAAPPAIEVSHPARESLAVLAYLALYSVAFLGFGMTALRSAFPAGQLQDTVVFAAKLGVHVVLPALLLVALGVRLAPILRAGVRPMVFWRTLIIPGVIILGLLSVVSPSLSQVAALRPCAATLAWTVPASFVWIAIEAGLNEEFLYRAVLQARLSAWFGSAWTGVAVTSVLFGLAHAPGLFLRGGPEVDGWSTDPLQVIAFTIATLAPLSLFLGFVYARTRSLLLVVLLHGLIDFLPHLPDFISTWARGA